MKREVFKGFKNIKVFLINNVYRFFVMWLFLKLDEDDGLDK